MTSGSKRTQRFCLWGTILAIPLWLGSIPASAWAQAVDNTVPLTITASPAADENLFLVRFVAEIYGSVPDSRNSREQQLMDGLERAKRAASWVRDLVRARGLDPQVGILSDDCIQYMTAYQTFLANRGAIEKRSDQQFWQNLGASLWKGYREGADVESDANLLGASRDEASDAGKVAGLFSGLNEIYSRSEQNGAAEKAAIDAELRKLNEVSQNTWSTDETVVQELTRAHGWAPGEAGFDNFQSNNLYDYVRRRPRDPFLLDWYARDTTANETANDLMVKAVQCIQAAKLVPNGTVYDFFRIDFMADATWLSLLAANLETPYYSSGYAPSSPQALQFARTYLALDPQDSTGFGHAQLARALAFSRHYRQAIEAANAASNSKSWGKADPGFCYRYAKLMSLTGYIEQADAWLSQAYALGFNDIQYVRNDVDLANFRRARPDCFVKLTTVNLRQPEVPQAVRYHDIILHNDSPFELTNVRDEVIVRENGQSLAPIVVQCKSIPAGGTCTDSNAAVFWDWGNAKIEATGTYECDQAVH